MFIAETSRLILREFVPADAAPLFDIYRDPAVMRFMGPPPASLEAEARNLAAHAENYYRRHGYGLWATVRKDTGDLIGRCGLLRFELEGEPAVEISYLLRRRHWGMGYATEAGARVVRFAFETAGVERLFAAIMPSNGASARVAERLGFHKSGRVTYKQFGLVDLYERDRGRGETAAPSPPAGPRPVC